jgi:hypothetical protein
MGAVMRNKLRIWVRSVLRIWAREALLNLVESQGREVAVRLLARYGAARLYDVRVFYLPGFILQAWWQS